MIESYQIRSAFCDGLTGHWFRGRVSPEGLTVLTSVRHIAAFKPPDVDSGLINTRAMVCRHSPHRP